MRDPLRHHRAHQTRNVMGDSFMERMSERVATGMGTVQFIVASTIIIAVWVLVNHAVGFVEASYRGLSTGKGFDPAPFILLNLIFSAVAFYTGALVIIAQKAAAKKDAGREAAEAKHREEIAAEHSKMLATVADLLNTDTAGGITVLVERIDELEVKLIHNGHRAEPPREPHASG